MYFKKRTNVSYLYSFIIHAVLVVIMLYVHFSIESADSDYVEVGFGTFGQFSSTGKRAKKEIVKENKKDEKKVKLPKTKNTDNENVAISKTKKKEKPEEEPNILDEEDTQGIENNSGLGSYGITFEWGGKGKRRIYSWIIPPYPEGVSKEIDVKLRFSILPDGSVGRIFPLIKVDTRLESAAINSLRQWRFEPLPSGLEQKEQTVVVIFPFRLQ